MKAVMYSVIFSNKVRFFVLITSDELSQKLGTLEALLDNLDRKKAEERNEFFSNHPARTAGFENDSLDEISSLSGLSSSIQSSLQQDFHQAVRLSL